MTTPRVDARRTDGRDVIIEAAVTCMVRRGYHGTSIREIAGEAGMTSAALYHHFASKQAVLVEAMRRALEESYEMTATAHQDGDNDGDRLAAMMDAWVRFHCIRRGYALIGASEIRSLDDAHRPDVIALRDRQEELFRGTIHHGVSSGAFTATDTVLATRALIAMGTSVASWFDPGGPRSVDSVAREYAQLALAMVGYGR